MQSLIESFQELQVSLKTAAEMSKNKLNLTLPPPPTTTLDQQLNNPPSATEE